MKKLGILITAAVSFIHIGLATVPSSSTGTIPEHLRPMLEKIQKEYNSGYWAQKFSQRNEMRTLGKLSAFAAVETVNAPVLMGTYSNSTAKYSPATFQELLFDGPNPTGTMTQFYLENSYGQLYMTGTAHGWFPTPRSFDYYVHDGGTRNAGLVYGGPDFTIDLLVEADKTVDFSKYVKYSDADGGHVPQLAIIHTGADAASGADNIWSHRWNIRWRFLQRKGAGSDPYFDVNKVMADGKYITNDSLNGKPVIIDGDYAIQPELAGSSNTSGNPKPIGVFTHEFGHIFGLPDLYDTDNSSAGLGNWCLMAGGSYGADGSHEATPAHMSAWCKEKLGWVTPTLVTSYLPQQEIKAVEKYPEIYRINVRNLGGGQYFLIENRQRIGYDQYLLGTGLLIYHIDPSRTNNSNEDRRLVDLEQADGLRQLNTTTGRGDAGDPFPGAYDNRNFDGYTSPDSKDYSLLQSYVGVRNISVSDTLMYADLDVGTRPYIIVKSKQETESGVNNNNGRIDPGESGSLVLKLENIYPTSLSNGKIWLTSTVNDVIVDTVKKNLSINSLDTQTVVLSSSITANPSAASKKIKIFIHIQTAEQTVQHQMDLFIGYPKILLMNLDSVAADNAASYYESTLQTLLTNYESIGTLSNTMNNAKVAVRDIIIVFSGKKTWEIISDSLGDQLLSFVNNGGNVFISGQNIAEDIKKRNSALSTSLIRSTWNKNILFGRVLNGRGTDMFGSQLKLLNVGGGNGAKNQISPDELIVDTTVAHPSFIWNATTGTAYGGVWWEHPSSGGKVVFWSFGFEAINDSAANANSKAEAMTAVMSWFGGITSTPDMNGPATAPFAYELKSNYPNPFNPSTTINYSIQKDGPVMLKVYDTLGKEVASLVNGKQTAGNHSVTFDASRLASGIYLYRLSSGSFVQTKKMVLLK
ncbi:MAG: M6 family metalloprotease domain-containing protein [Ignavibacteriales bacterium]|nr:M6 family metalloprotease domain-containing protein [Ignavibacteriales bacterium]